jgi:molybdopterin synthase catalytic subunit
MLKEIVGRAEDAAELNEGARVEDLFVRYARQYPRLGELRSSLVASVNQEFAGWAAPLSGGDEVAFLPPVSGGRETTMAEDLFELVRTPIRNDEIIEQMKAPEDGAVVVFDGIVRNHFQGRRTLYLVYEAYEAMALRKMRAIGAEARARFPVHRLAIVHRLGRLEIGETSVLIVVSSSHRRAAFDACRYAIDSFKRSVPIWKKEYLADGAVWAEGEVPSVKPFCESGESIP